MNDKDLISFHRQLLLHSARREPLSTYRFSIQLYYVCDTLLYVKFRFKLNVVSIHSIILYKFILFISRYAHEKRYSLGI